MDDQNVRTRVLVLGGTGFIGSNLVRYLIHTGHEVCVYHRKESTLKNLEGLPFESIIGDLTDIENLEPSLNRAMEGCQAIYNLAACGTSLKKHHRLREIVNVKAAQTVARVARQIGDLRLIHISSSAAVGFPLNNEIANEHFPFNGQMDPYAVTKRQGEQEVLKEAQKGLDAVIAIPCSTVGTHAMKTHQYHVFKNIAHRKTVIYPPGGLCLTNVHDLVRGFVLCYEKGMTGKRYILGGHNITYKQYFDEIARATHGKPPWLRLPKTLLPWLGLGVEILSNLLKKETTIDKHVGEMIAKNLYYSSEVAIKELGYSITDWRETIRITVQDLQERGLL